MGRARRRWFGRAGCLLWILAMILVVLLLSVVFGGFRLGHRSSGLGGSPGLGGARPGAVAAYQP